MRFSVAPLAAAIATLFAASGAFPQSAVSISGPHIHENLAVYFVHGASAEGPVPLTLNEALAKGSVQVVETGRVNELQIENKGSEHVFIQVGDIVKGGRQDRVLTVSLDLPPNSGLIPIASFCVEQGRWAARGKEDQATFSSAREAMPSVSALLAMAAPPAATGATRPAGAEPAQRNAPDAEDVAGKQRKVWDSVASTQRKLSSGLNAPVASPQSASSLQLSLENEKLKQARAAYMEALKPPGEKDSDIVGYVVAINGKISAASIYPSHALFRKMWEKQLAAVITESIGEKPSAAATAAAPAAPTVSEFLGAAEKGKSYERALAAGMRQETRDGELSLFNEARAADGKWIHRSYLAK